MFKHLWILAWLLPTTCCYAASGQVIPPADRNDAVSLTFDRSQTSVSNLTLYDHDIGVFEDNDHWIREYGKSGWICTDDKNTANGSCDAKTIIDDFAAPPTIIKLLFVEQRSLTQVWINVEAYNEGLWPAVCSEHPTKYKINFAGAPHCYSAGKPVSGRALSASITANELKKIPYGGIWKAKMVLEERGIVTSGTETHLATWTKTITLNVTDMNNQQIYLPDFGNAAPHVDLNLRPLPGTTGNHTMLSGTATLDMCLYDGYNANSSTFILSPKDDHSGLPGREYGLFSVYHNGKTDDANRIDYQLKILNLVSREFIDLKNWQNYVATGISAAPLRSVHLPGIPEAVLCVPTALRFVTPEFAITSKTAGSYTGTLHLTFTTGM